MVKYNKIAPQLSIFEGVERIKKEELADKEIKILAYADMIGEENDIYCIGLIEHNKKQYTTTFSDIITKRLHEIMEKLGRDEKKGNEKEKYFNEIIEAVIVERKSVKNPNRTYYTLE